MYVSQLLTSAALLAVHSASSFLSPTPLISRHQRVSRDMSNDKGADEMLTLVPEETALILIEYQNEFTTEGGALHGAVKDCMEASRTLHNSQAAADCARSAGCTIIHVPIVFDEGHQEINSKPYGILAGIKENEIFKKGTWGADFYSGMKPVDGDIVASGKRGLCGFATTNLDFILRQNNCKNIVLAGFLTNCCVESTMRSGYELGYNVHTLTDCCAATSIEAQDAAFEYTFGMFSKPMKSDDFKMSLNQP